MIALLRDPVERTLSQVFHAKRHGFENLDLEECLEAEATRLASGSIYSLQKHSYIARSRYLEQLDRYEKIFSKESLLVLKSEDFFENTEVTWYHIQKFIKVKEISMPIKLPKANAGKSEAISIDPRIRDRLRKTLATTAIGVKTRYGIDWGWG